MLKIKLHKVNILFNLLNKIPKLSFYDDIGAFPSPFLFWLLFRQVTSYSGTSVKKIIFSLVDLCNM